MVSYKVKIIHLIYDSVLPWLLSSKESACQSSRHGFDPWVGKRWRPTPVFLPGKSTERRVWWARVHGVAKESDMTERLNNNNIWSSLIPKYLFKRNCWPQLGDHYTWGGGKPLQSEIIYISLGSSFKDSIGLYPGLLAPHVYVYRILGSNCFDLVQIKKSRGILP